MNRVEAIITLTNTASLLRDGTRYMKPEHEKQFREAFEMAIKALEQEQPDNSVAKIADLVEGSIDHFDLDDAMDLLYQIKEVLQHG